MTKSTLHFMLIPILLAPNDVEGQYSLTVSPNPAVTGATVTYTCTTSPVQTAVQWTETNSGTVSGYVYYPNNGQCERSSGNPPADYTFTCNTAGVFTVRFPANYNRHSGSMWKCGDAVGNTGESSSITLSVHVPLTGVTLLNSSALIVDQGTSVTLVCETNPTNPVSTITWRRGTQTVSQGVTSSTRSTTQGRVRISSWTKSVQWGDRGEYSCLASWSSPAVTKTSQSLSLVVQVPVSAVTLTNITSPNQEIHITEDSTLVLSCQTSPAYPAPTVRWYITGIQTSSGVVNQTYTQTNGQYITVSTITKRVTKDNDRDTYYCRAGGQQSLTASVNVYYGPDVGQLKLTKPSVVAEGVQVTLNCRTLTSVNPDVNFSWSYEDNTPITSGIGSKQGSARNTWSQTLTVTPVRDSNRQVVRCRISNTEANVGDNVLASTDLDVNYGPDSGEVQLTKTSIAIEHEPVTLTCRTTNNVKPDVTFTWRIDGSEVTSGTGVKQGSSGSTWSQTLTLTPNRDQHSVGCTVSNSQISRQSSASVDLDVNFAPDITFNPVDIKEGQPLTLRCESSGRPHSYNFHSFTQYWGDTEVDKQTGTKAGAVYIWTTQTATYLDAGVYECSVDNGVTDIRGVLVQRKRVSVHVRASPIFTMDTVKIIAAEIGSTAVVSQAFYNSDLNYTSVKWTYTRSKSVVNKTQSVSMSMVTLKKNSKEVKVEGFMASVVINNFKEEDIRMYVVTVCNSIGCSSSSLRLTGAGPPFVPLELIVTNTTQRSISLRWKPNFPGGDFTQVFILNYRLQGSGDWNTKEYQDNPGGYVYADITDLQPGSVYEFKVKARNNRDMNNEGNFTEIIQGSTKSFIAALPPSSSSLGIGLGIGLGICLPLTVGLVILVVYFRRRMVLSKSNGTKGQSDNSQGQGRTESSGNRAATDAPPDNRNQAEYSHLQESDPQQYTDLRLYQNTEGIVNEGMEYEKINDSPPATYETVALHEYSN